MWQFFWSDFLPQMLLDSNLKHLLESIKEHENLEILVVVIMKVLGFLVILCLSTANADVYLSAKQVSFIETIVKFVNFSPFFRCFAIVEMRKIYSTKTTCQPKTNASMKP